jgi:hypothetical protein
MLPEPGFQQSELDQIHADIRKLMAETMRVNAETRKPSRIGKLYPMMLVGSLIGAVGVATGIALSFLLGLH